ncbi:hypothetical protein WK41_21770 [Burkholderia cepacia]|nr:hypothetical protein WK41_21770 [Burkholderia cepacia]
MRGKARREFDGFGIPSAIHPDVPRDAEAKKGVQLPVSWLSHLKAHVLRLVAYIHISCSSRFGYE